MASENRHSARDLIETLALRPHEFHWRQAARLLELLATSQAPDRETGGMSGISSLEIPVGEVAEAQGLPKEGGALLPILGIPTPAMYGYAGCLPFHDALDVEAESEARSRRPSKGEGAMRDWIDLFGRRFSGYFARASFHPIATVRCDADTPPIEFVLLSLIGFESRVWGRGQRAGGPPRMPRDSERDQALRAVADAGFRCVSTFASSRRTPQGLLDVLETVLEMPAAVEELHGRWLAVSSGDLWRLGRESGFERTGTLDGGSFLGERVWDTQSGVCISIGPVGLRQYLTLIPSADASRRMSDLVRAYLGPEYDVRYRVKLRGGEIPEARLCCSEEPGAIRLGWHGWLTSKGPRLDFQDAIFRLQ